VANLRRRDLEGAAFEADVVRMLCAGPFVVDLRQDRGAKGDDYDTDLRLHNRVRPIEVKIGAEDVPYSDRALARKLLAGWLGGAAPCLATSQVRWLFVPMLRRRYPVDGTRS